MVTTAQHESKTASWALDYATLGYPVFPIWHPLSNTSCACGKSDCDRIGKHPHGKLAPHGLTDATTDIETIRKWWRREPRASIGILTDSKKSKIFMVGPDGKLGVEQFAALQVLHGELPRTPKARSGNADPGEHYIFRWPDGWEIKNGRNIHGTTIDVRGEGGYFVATPSLHKSGNEYEWIVPPMPDCLPADAPEWLLLWILYGDTLAPPPENHQANGKADHSFRGRATGNTPHDRAIKYLNKCAPAISGQGGHPRTMSIARAICYGFDLGKDVGFELLRNHWNDRCLPPWSDGELKHKCDDAIDTPDPKGRPRGYLLNENRPGRPATKTSAPAPPIKERCGELRQPPAEIILEYFRETHRPVFRRGTSIHTAAGEDVQMNVACALPTTELIDRLASAEDAPTYKGKNPEINRNALPGFFRTWARVAWGDMLKTLPEEDTAHLGADAPAAETFRQLMRELLTTSVTLGDEIKGSTVIHTERRTLLSWCQKFAKTGIWKDIRSLCCWCKLQPHGDGGEVKLLVALRHELINQLHGDRRLKELGAKRFSRLCAKYGVGRATETERPYGHRAIVLDPGFLDDLVSGLPIEDDPLPIGGGE